MKIFSLIVLLVANGALFGQEYVRALKTNPNLAREINLQRKSALNSLDSTFLYIFESLPLANAWDDFSTDKFQSYDPDYAGAGVTSEWFYRLMDETNTVPQDPTLIFCDSAHSNTVTYIIEEGVEVDQAITYDFTPISVWVNDLNNFPVIGGLRMFYEECFVLVDSLIDGVLDLNQDTIWYNTLPGPAFVQDSAHVFTKVVSDNKTLWIDKNAYHNYTFAVNPWSLGVATFDGVDENGMPYALGDDDAQDVADYLTSRPIDLSVATPGEDLVFLDFIFQPKGFGNMPEDNDSLLVDFLDPITGEWVSAAWHAIASEVGENVWDTAHIAVSPGLFVEDFQFRIKNYATLSGALDHWHVDYVSVEIAVELEISSFNDVAIMYPLNTILKDYTAVPWDHYKANTTGNEQMLTDLELLVYNCTSTGTNFTNGEWQSMYDEFLQGGSPFNIPNTASPSVNFDVGITTCTFDGASDYYYDQALAVDQAAFDLKFHINSAAGPDKNVYKQNDTTQFVQDFRNYYAYDDGIPEAAYGVDGVGSLLAYKFEAYQPGQLTGILMNFVPSVTDVSDEVFLLTVWADNAGIPGDIIYQDDYFESHSPIYSGSIEGFKYYTFTRDLYLVDGYLPVDEIFYVGWQNISEQSLNIGLDWNIDNSDKVFRNTSGVWLNSAFDMSLLIRPVFSTALDYTLSNPRENTAEVNPITIYPNPTRDLVNISGLPENSLISIYDMSGRLVKSVANESQLTLEDVVSGVYLVNITNEQSETIYSSRIIKN